jgi:hypothetical protein
MLKTGKGERRRKGEAQVEAEIIKAVTLVML